MGNAKILTPGIAHHSTNLYAPFRAFSYNILLVFSKAISRPFLHGLFPSMHKKQTLFSWGLQLLPLSGTFYKEMLPIMQILVRWENASRWCSRICSNALVPIKWLLCTLNGCTLCTTFSLKSHTLMLLPLWVDLETGVRSKHSSAL